MISLNYCNNCMKPLTSFHLYVLEEEPEVRQAVHTLHSKDPGGVSSTVLDLDGPLSQECTGLA